MELNIDKTGWKKVKFGEVCRQVNETERNPQEEGLLHVVGLEHIGSNDLHIRSWNTLERETTFTRKFVKGQVLFGRRRAYQAKVAYAEFDGICSGDILVFEAIKSKLLPELLPFIVQSQKFYNKAVETSAGSLSPRTKFKDLADLEFLLPPKDQQARFAELLWAADEVVEREREVKEGLENQYSLSVEYLMKQTYEKVQLKKCTSINCKSLSSKTPSDFKLKYIDIASIIAPKKLGDLSTYSFVEAPSRARRIVKKNDLVISMVRPYLKAFVQIKTDEPNLIASTGTAIVYANKNISNDYVFHTLFSKDFIAHCENRMNGTNYPAITSSDLGEFSIPLPNFEVQIKLADDLNKIDDTIVQLDSQIVFSQKLKQGLINEIF